MRIAELKQREDFNNLFLASIELLFQSIEPDLALCTTPVLPFQTWYYHPFYGVFVQRKLCAQARHFLYQSMRHGSKKWRSPIQNLASYALHLGPGFELALRPAFALNGSIRGAQYAVILPGNQRIRLFCFDTQRCRVQRKAGFSQQSLSQEIRLRQRLAGRFECILPIVGVGPNEDYFDEPLVTYQPLNRFLPTKLKPDFYQTLAHELVRIGQEEQSVVSARAYVDALLERLVLLLEALNKRWPGLATERLLALWECCARLCADIQTLPLALSHGDFQAGNVLRDPHSAGFAIIDWEDARVRFALYDALCFYLQARQPQGLIARIAQFIATAPDDPFWAVFSQFGVPRLCSVALFVLEDWAWTLEVSLREGIKYCPLGLRARLDLCENLHLLLSCA